MTGNERTMEIITSEAFAPFGAVIDWTPALDSSETTFHVLLRSEAPTGWRLAVNKVAHCAVQRLGSHPDTWEMFAPLRGTTAIVVAPAGARDDAAVRVFLLDRPVCVAPGVWHGTLALSESATVLIAENLEVSSAMMSLSQPVGLTLAKEHMPG